MNTSKLPFTPHTSLLTGGIVSVTLMAAASITYASAQASNLGQTQAKHTPQEPSEPELPAPDEEPESSAVATCSPQSVIFSAGCEIDMTHPVDPLWACPVDDVSIHHWDGHGLTLAIDMSDPFGQSGGNGSWDMLEVVGQTDGLMDYALNIGNSPSNNAWTGDSGQFSNDAEAHLYGETLRVWHSDRAQSGLALQVNNSVSSSGGFFEATVCDGTFIWQSDTTSPTMVTHPNSIFQFDGNEPDTEAGGTNDTILYVSFNQVVAGSYRSGDGIEPYPYLILSAF